MKNTLLKCARFAVQNAPFTPQKLLWEKLLNSLFAEQIADDDLDCLENRVLRIEVREIQANYDFSLVNRQIKLLPAQDQVDVIISAAPLDYLLMMTRAEDPDSLFFQRRMQISGDTELGLEIKNQMDAMEFDNFPVVLQKMLAMSKSGYQFWQEKSQQSANGNLLQQKRGQ